MTACNAEGGGRTQMLYSFESYEEIASIHLAQFIGKASLNEDSDYVSHGKSSLKVEIEEPWLLQNTWTQKNNEASPRLTIDYENYFFSMENVTDTELFGVDVYNESDLPLSVVFWIKDRQGILLSSMAEIAPHVWTEAKFPVNRHAFADRGEEVLSYNFSIVGEGMFSSGTTTVYFDRFYAVKTTDSVVPLIKTGEDLKILDFNSLEDLSWVAAFNDYAPAVNIGYNVDSRYAAEGGSLKLSVLCMPENNILFGLYPNGQRSGVLVVKDGLDAVDFTLLKYSYSPKVSCNFYNNSASAQTVYMEMTDGDGNAAKVKASALAYGWTKISITDFTGIDLSDVATLRIYVDSCYIMEYEEYYVDDIRMEI